MIPRNPGGWVSVSYNKIDKSMHIMVVSQSLSSCRTRLHSLYISTHHSTHSLMSPYRTLRPLLPTLNYGKSNSLEAS